MQNRFITRLSRLLAILAITSGMFFAPAMAITRRDDVLDQAYINLGNDPKYASVGALTFNGFITSGTLISPKWVLTAGHAVDVTTTAPHTFTLGVTPYAETQHFNHPNWLWNSPTRLADGWDIGLVQLSSAVSGVTPASRYFGFDETTHLGTFVGYGASGTGSLGANGPTGTKRAMRNGVDVTGGPGQGFDAKSFGSDFDNPVFDNQNWSGTPNADPMEGSIATGDSGGGAFIDLNSRWYVAGVHSFVANTSDGVTNSSYTDIFISTRVSQFNEWIDDNIANNWKTAVTGAFTAGSNWSSTTPVAGDIAGFNVGGTYAVNFSGSVSNHQLLARNGNVTFNLNGSYTLTSTMFDGSVVVGRYNTNNAALTFTGGTLNSNDANLAEQVGSIGQVTLGNAAAWQVNGNVYIGGTYNGAGGNATLTVQNSNSSLNVTGTAKIYGGGTLNYSAGSVFINNLDVTGGRVKLTPGGNKVLRTNSLTISSGQIDLSDNDMIVDYSGSSPLFDIRAYLHNAKLISSKAATSPNAGEAGKTALGYGEAAALNITIFDNINITTPAVLIKYTYGGDANIDGKVNLSDLTLFASHWQTSGYWPDGDFNYDSFVNLSDLTILSNNWQAGVSNPLGPSFNEALASLELPIFAVPEPHLAVLAAACLFLRRYRRRD